MYSTLQNQYELSDLDVLKLKRGINIVKKNLFLMVVIYGLSIYYHVFLMTFIMHLSYFAIRLTSFGAHLQRFFVCMCYSILIFVGLPYLLSQVSIPYFILMICLCLSWLLIALLSPCPTLKHPVASKYHRKLKIQSMITTTILSSIALFLPPSLSQAMICGICIQSISLLPIFKKE